MMVRTLSSRHDMVAWLLVTIDKTDKPSNRLGAAAFRKKGSDNTRSILSPLFFFSAVVSFGNSLEQKKRKRTRLISFNSSFAFSIFSFEKPLYIRTDISPEFGSNAVRHSNCGVAAGPRKVIPWNRDWDEAENVPTSGAERSVRG